MCWVFSFVQVQYPSLRRQDDGKVHVLEGAGDTQKQDPNSGNSGRFKVNSQIPSHFCSWLLLWRAVTVPFWPIACTDLSNTPELLSSWLTQIKGRAATLNIYLQMVKPPSPGHSKWWNPFCLIIEATATSISGVHNSGRGASQTGENRFSEASPTPGEAERSVTVQAPVLTLHFCSGSCLWFLIASPCLLVPASDLSTEKGCLTLSSPHVAKLVQPNLSVLPVLLRYRAKY